MILAHNLVDETVFQKSTTEDQGDNKSPANADTKEMSLRTVYEISKKENVVTVFLTKNIAVSPMHIPFAVLQLYLIEKFNVTEATNSFIQMMVGLLIMIVNGIGIPFLRNRFNETKLILFGIICLVCFIEKVFLIQKSILDSRACTTNTVHLSRAINWYFTIFGTRNDTS